jgi:hypothetical protein
VCDSGIQVIEMKKMNVIWAQNKWDKMGLPNSSYPMTVCNMETMALKWPLKCKP